MYIYKRQLTTAIQASHASGCQLRHALKDTRATRKFDLSRRHDARFDEHPSPEEKSLPSRNAVPRPLRSVRMCWDALSNIPVVAAARAVLLLTQGSLAASAVTASIAASAVGRGYADCTTIK